jgi:adenylate cyclase
MTDELLSIYDQAVDHFIAGHWDEAYRLLHLMPAGDRAQDFLSVLIAQHNRIPPSDWDGTVRLSK